MRGPLVVALLTAGAIPVQQNVHSKQVPLCSCQMQGCAAIIVWHVNWDPVFNQQADPANIPSTGSLSQDLRGMLQLQATPKATYEVTDQVMASQ